MKLVISSLAGLFIFLGILFFIDPLIVNFIIKTLEITENVSLIKAIIWIAIVAFTGGISAFLSIFIGWLLYIILEIT